MIQKKILTKETATIVQIRPFSFNIVSYNNKSKFIIVKDSSIIIQGMELQD